MSEPTPIERAVALIYANPRDRAVYEFALAFTERREQDGAATYLRLTDVAPDPTTLLRLADEMAGHARTYRAAIAALGFADIKMEQAEHEGRRDRALAGMRAAFTSGGFDG